MYLCVVRRFACPASSWTSFSDPPQFLTGMGATRTYLAQRPQPASPHASARGWGRSGRAPFFHAASPAERVT